MKLKMKNLGKTLIVCFTALLLVLSCFVGQVSAATTWSTQTVDSGLLSSLALDSANNPHIAHWKTNSDNTIVLQYSSWTGSSWNNINVDSSYGVTIAPSLVLDEKDNPHISYICTKQVENTIEYCLKYAMWTGSSWSISTVHSGGAGGICLALDSNGNSHISYFDMDLVPPTFGNTLVYSSLTGTVWETQTVDTTVFPTIGQTSLVFDSNGNPHIAYPVRLNALKYAVGDGANWNIQTLQTGNIGLTASLILDKNDYPHISYQYNNGTGYHLLYAQQTRSVWNFETITTAGIGGIMSSLSLDSNDNPHIAYGTDMGLKYVSWTGLKWNVAIADLVSCGYGFPCLALDSLDYAHVSYCDQAATGAETPISLKYAYEIPEFQAGSKVTGGGQTTSSIDGKATFGFNVMFQQKSSTPKGNLHFEDQAAGIKIQSSDISSFLVSQDGTKATFTGTCTVNGDSPSFRAYVEDNGEPGRNDVFTITLSNGYTAGGTLLSGNIQMHKTK